MPDSDATIIDSLSYVLVWDGCPIAAFGQRRDGEWALRTYGEDAIRDENGYIVADDSIQDMVTDLGEVELELREYGTGFSDYAIIGSRYLRPRPDDDDGTDLVGRALRGS